jgi:ADP-ribose pyrophosphatase
LSEILCEGQHMLFLRTGNWEYVEHRVAKEAAMIVAVTDDGRLVLAEEFRPPIGRPVLSLPTGLIGDEGAEDAANAARRELSEETGYSADAFTPIGRGPGSAGQSSETIRFFLARPARRDGEQAAHDRDRIRVHAVPLGQLRSWTARREAEGAAIDPKIWAGLWMAGLLVLELPPPARLWPGQSDGG